MAIAKISGQTYKLKHHNRQWYLIPCSLWVVFDFDANTREPNEFKDIWQEWEQNPEDLIFYLENDIDLIRD